MTVAAAVVAHAVAYGDSAVRNTLYLGVLVGAGAGAWMGAARAPRGSRLVPRLIAAGVSLSALGDVTWTVLDLFDPASVDRQWPPGARLLWVESPTNPALGVVDIAALA